MVMMMMITQSWIQRASGNDEGPTVWKDTPPPTQPSYIKKPHERIALLTYHIYSGRRINYSAK